MRNLLWCILIILLTLCCSEDTDIDLNCIIEHTTTIVKLESTLLGETEYISVNLVWTWLLGKPDGDAIIIERSIGDSTSYAVLDTLWQITSPMYYVDHDTALHAHNIIYYRLGLLNNQYVNYFKNTTLTIPSSQHFYQPASDTLSDTLVISYAKLSEFSSCQIKIYKAVATEPESLLNLTNELFDTSMTYPDTTITIFLADSIFPDTSFYTIKISSLDVGQLITSIGFRAFFKKP